MSGSLPRIFCIPARDAPLVAVLRRGPSRWWQLGRWHLDEQSYEPGAWFAGILYPQKCDLSPDGRWLAYSALKVGADWSGGSIYDAISRLPWLHALAAWNAGTTYTRGIHFDTSDRTSDLGPPDVGDASPCLRRFGLRITRARQFAVERRRGWHETDDTPPHDPHDSWDERRRVRMRKVRPGGSESLTVEGSYAAFRTLPRQRDPALYSLSGDGDEDVLHDVQWADWSSDGRLLVATTDGRLQIRELGDAAASTTFDHDLSLDAPTPLPPPAWAREW